MGKIFYAILLKNKLYYTYLTSCCFRQCILNCFKCIVADNLSHFNLDELSDSQLCYFAFISF